MNCFESCICHVNRRMPDSARKRSSRVQSIHTIERTWREEAFDHRKRPNNSRPLKSLPVREKTGDVFQHPDIPICDLEDLVKEAMASRTPGDIYRSHQPPAEIRRAWDCDTKLNSKPIHRNQTAVNITQILEVRSLESSNEDDATSNVENNSSSENGRDNESKHETTCVPVTVCSTNTNSHSSDQQQSSNTPVKEDAKSRRRFWTKLPIGKK